MNHIKLDSQGEAVREFFLSLSADPDGAIVELNGQAVARLLPIATSVNGGQNNARAWTQAKNDRRCDLIDRKYAGGLTPQEEAELKGLQDEMIYYRQQVAPLPLEHARRLHQELLMKAQHKSASE